MSDLLYWSIAGGVFTLGFVWVIISMIKDRMKNKGGTEHGILAAAGVLMMLLFLGIAAAWPVAVPIYLLVVIIVRVSGYKG